jgi:natural product precursor
MKQRNLNKLSLGKKTISKLHEQDMRQVNGGSSYVTYRCNSSNCPHTWSCPPPPSSGSGSGGGGVYLLQAQVQAEP